MVTSRAGFGALAALVGVLPGLVAAQNTTAQVAASTFYLAKTDTQFSVNVANDSSDVYIYLSSPAFSWVSFGFGGKMEDSLMFVAYSNENGDNVTLSPRIGSRASEPTFTPDVKIDILPGTQINDSMFILSARCRACRTWPHGSIDVRSTAQPMIYAFGPGDGLTSNSPSADLKRHVRYGQFTMDMVAATGAGGVPAKSSASGGVKDVGELVKDHDRANLAHSIIGCLALFVLWPLNVLVAGFLKNIKIHLGVSVLALAFLITSFALGISVSGEYNRSKSFTTPHQILAFLSLLPLLLLSITPIPTIARLHAKIPSLHTPLTSAAFFILVLTGGLGLHLSSQTRSIILVYTALSLLVAVFLVTLTTCIRRRGSARARAEKARVRKEEDGEVMLGKMEGRGSQGSQESWVGGGGAYGNESAVAVPGAYAYAGGEQQQHQYQQQHQQQQYQQQYQQQQGQGQGQGLGQGQYMGPNGVYGGGAMPGPQYLLNMHPGVPVQVSRM